MGTYNNSVDDLVGVIWSALDEVEGDFDRATLRAALKKCRGYSPTTDDKFVEPVWWKPWTWCQGYWRPVRLNAALKTRLKEDVYLRHRERLVQALKKYGSHTSDCCSHKNTEADCCCGFNDALTAVGEKV